MRHLFFVPLTTLLAAVGCGDDDGSPASDTETTGAEATSTTSGTAGPTTDATTTTGDTTGDTTGGSTAETTTTDGTGTSDGTGGSTGEETLADLSVTVVDAVDATVPGVRVYQVFRVDNAGPQSATNVEVVDTLPAGVTVQDVRASQGTCSGDDASQTCSLGELDVGDRAWIWVVFTPSGTGDLVNEVSATSDLADADGATASHSVAAGGSTFVVNDVDDGDDGTCNVAHCSLREAINAANDSDGLDLIAFDIEGDAPYEIQPTTALPVLSEPVIIDGTTEPAYVDVPVISLLGATVATGPGLSFTGGSSIVRGISVGSGWTDAIAWSTAGNNRVEASHICMNAAGTEALGALHGVQVTTGDNIIGGTHPDQGNLVSGCTYGVHLSGAGATGNRIEGNLMGPRIDFDPWGSPIGNAAVWFDGAPGNVVGGTIPGATNTIGEIDSVCLLLEGAATSNVIVGNGIGTDLEGSVSTIGCISEGLSVNDTSEVRFGGIDPGEGNTLGDQVRVRDSSTATILGNRMWVGDGIIDLGSDGATVNDADDPDSGPNSLQNYPIVDTVTVGATSTTLAGSLDSLASTTFRIELFEGDCDAPEISAPLDSFEATTDNMGDLTFSRDIDVVLATGRDITATATNVDTGETSEFAPCTAVP